MYFETIHDIDQFDEVRENDTYSSYLEADSDLDDVALGNLLFAHVNGDSASVLCLEQVSDVLTAREREKQLHKGGGGGGRPNSMGSKGPNVEEDDEQGELRTERGAECLVSHHSGSDGMYDQPEEAFAPEDPAEHIYETLDDCGEQYVLYIAKGSDGSGHSGDAPAKPSSDVSDKSDGSGKPKLPKQNSVPNSQESAAGPQDNERRKSEGDVVRRKKRCTEKEKERAEGSAGAPKLPPNRPSRVSRTSADSAEYAAVTNASVERRNSLKKSAPVLQATPQPLVIKHKGKTYLIPVVESKESKSEKSKSKRQSRNNPNSMSKQTISLAVPPQMVVAGVTLRPMSRSESIAFSTCAYQAATLPISIKTDQFSPQRRKSSKHVASYTSQHANAPMSQVTHYGVL